MGWHTRGSAQILHNGGNTDNSSPVVALRLQQVVAYRETEMQFVATYLPKLLFLQARAV